MNFKEYILNRIKKDDYRGFHLSQHNRLPFDKVLKFLTIIYEIAKDEKFNIHIGDWKGVKQKNCDTYYKIVQKINDATEQCTVNSLKKNIFPDLHRMGLLERYDKNGNLVPQYVKAHIYSVKLSENAVEFINEKEIRRQYKIYIESTEKILEPIFDELFYLLYNKYDAINVYEYMYIISDPSLETNEKISLINNFRKLKKIEQTQISEDIKKEFQQINKSAKNKSEKRDFGNWYNESLQVFNLLNQTVYFKTFRKTFLMLSISQEAYEFIATRSQQEKEKYFEWHKVSKKEGFELHHIYPVYYATTRKQLELIDNHKNLIYIKSSTHKEVSKNKNLVRLEYKENKIFLTNPNNNKSIDITRDVIVDINNIQEMLKYNSKILNSIDNLL